MMSTYRSLVKSLKMMGRRLPLYLMGILMMTAFNALFEVAGSFFMKIIFEAAGNGMTPMYNQKIAVAVICGILSIILSSVFMCVYNNEAKRMTLALKEIVFAKALKLPYAYYEEHHSSEIISKMVYDTDVASNIYSSRLRRVLAPIIYVVVFAVAMVIINPLMTVILIALNVLLFIANTMISKPMKKVGKQLSQKNMVMTNIISNIIAGVEITKMYDVNHTGIRKYKDENNEYVSTQKEKMRLSALLDMLNTAFDLLCSLMFIVVGIVLIQNGLATIGEIAAIFTLYTSLSVRFLQLGKNVPELINCIAYAERIFEFLNLPEENKCTGGKSAKDGSTGSKSAKYNGAGNQSAKYNSIDNQSATNSSTYNKSTQYSIIGSSAGMKPDVNAVDCENITFGYKGKELLFTGSSYRFPANKIIAVTGHSGCGKSTLAKLLLGFYELQDGNINIFGQNICDIGIGAARRQIAYVPQIPYMYNMSIRENIRCGKPDASDEEIISAAKHANAHEFIMASENGYDTVLNNRGNNLSGGQRQRIAIARAIIKDSPIILMDEATSALDNESEQLISEAVVGLKNRKTVIMIAHRVTTIQSADMVVEV